MSLITEFDTLDDRRELHRALGSLPPAKRVEFVRYCVTKAKPIGNRSPSLHLDAKTKAAITAAYRGDDDADDAVTNEMWGFLILLAAQWHLPLSTMAKDLDLIARGRSLDHGGGVGAVGPILGLSDPRAAKAGRGVPALPARVLTE